MTSIESSFNDGESDEHSTAVSSTLTRARRVGDREGTCRVPVPACNNLLSYDTLLCVFCMLRVLGHY